MTERYFAFYKGYTCYFNGLRWESQFGDAPTFPVLQLVIDQDLNDSGTIRVSTNSSEVTIFGTVEDVTDDSRLIVHWDMGPTTKEHEDNLVFLSPVGSMYDDYNQRVTEARLLPTGGGGNAIVGYGSYLREKSAQKGQIKDGMLITFPKWEELKLYFKDGEYLG